MADHQRIHPVQQDQPAEAPSKPTAPLVPRNSSRSDNGNPEDPYYPVPLQRTIPLTQSKPPKRRRSCCLRCFCWTFCLLFVIVILLGVLAAIIYFGFDPKTPKYSIDGLRVTQFNLNSDNSLDATFNVNITTRNPNSKIGIYYEGGSRLSVWYFGTRLCEGALPKFYQGHRNTTVLDVPLSGRSDDASTLLSTLQAQQQTGTIPLRLRARVPVRIRLGNLKLPKVRFSVRCNLNVDSLAADNVVRIRDSDCKFRLRR